MAASIVPSPAENSTGHLPNWLAVGGSHPPDELARTTSANTTTARDSECIAVPIQTPTASHATCTTKFLNGCPSTPRTSDEKIKQLASLKTPTSKNGQPMSYSTSSARRVAQGAPVPTMETTARPQLPSGNPIACDTELILIRGLPGSGKTTMAAVLAMIGYKHFEADMFFEVGGVYRYDSSRIRDAHAWCKQSTQDALTAGTRVVVSNTFTRLDEMGPYRSMTTNLQVIEARGQWENVHGVPAEMLARMALRWEPLAAHK